MEPQLVLNRSVRYVSETDPNSAVKIDVSILLRKGITYYLWQRLSLTDDVLPLFE